MKIHYLQHIAFENPGSILSWAKENQYPISATHLYRNETLPELDEFDWLIVMGGPMNIYEEESYPWLRAEKEFIKTAIERKKVVIGLCLGAQLIADIIGGRVIRNQHKEIGWFPITLCENISDYPEFSFLPSSPIVFEWHGDTFVDLPKEAILIATNEGCKNQAYIYKKRVYGFQFHLENTMTIIEDLIKNCSDEMVPERFVQSAEVITAHNDYIEQDNKWMKMFLTKLAVMYEEEEI
ncbi:type 1 glutamine amidotransferase [Anaerosporobacter sp.]